MPRVRYVALSSEFNVFGIVALDVSAYSREFRLSHPLVFAGAALSGSPSIVELFSVLTF
jgi:hypothetical protein